MKTFTITRHHLDRNNYYAGCEDLKTIVINGEKIELTIEAFNTLNRSLNV